MHQGASDSLPVCWQGLERMWSSMVKERRARSWGLVLSKIVGRRPQTVRGHHALGEEEDVSSRSKWRRGAMWAPGSGFTLGHEGGPNHQEGIS